MRIVILAFLIIDLFLVPSHSVTMKCEYKIENYDKNSYDFVMVENAYTCFGTVEHDCDELEIITGVSNVHMDGKNRADIEMLYLKDNQKIIQLPPNMHKIFPNLLGIRLMYSKLNAISSDDLKFPKLKALYLGINERETLDANLIEHMPNLELAGFDHNKIMKVGDGILNSLPKLKFVYFNNNVCTKNIWNMHARYGNRKQIDHIKTVGKMRN